MTWRLVIGLAGTVTLLTGCSAYMDMQGNDPVEYYSDHPIKNRIELHTAKHTLHFGHEDRLPPQEITKLREDLHGISMMAVDSIQVSYPKGEAPNEERKRYIAKLMRHMGYTKNNFMYEPAAGVASGDVRFDVAYAVVVGDMRQSGHSGATTTYSNTWQGNFKCSQEVNTGLMVADPHDMVRGTGDTVIDTPSASRVVHDYHAGIAPAAAISSSGSSSGNNGSGNGSSGGSSSGGSGNASQ